MLQVRVQSYREIERFGIFSAMSSWERIAAMGGFARHAQKKTLEQAQSVF
jgi:hypothetical protein